MDQFHPDRNRAIKIRRLLLFAGIFLVLIAIVLLIFFLCSQHQSTSPSAPPQTKHQDMVGDSKYANIRSHFIIDENGTQKVYIEYPLTGNKKIDRAIAKQINRQKRYFEESCRASSIKSSKPCSFHAAYEVNFMDDLYISITTSVKYDAHAAHPVFYTMSQTFERQSGKLFPVSKLFRDNSDHLFKLIVLNLHSQFRQRGIMDYSSWLGESFTKKQISNFAIVDKRSLLFSFGKGRVFPESYGDVNVSIAASELKDHLEPKLAKEFFDLDIIIEPTDTNSSQKIRPSACSGKCLALTFDDGPGIYTNQLLDILASQQVRVTFFTLGKNVQARPDVVKRAASLGHQIGNHSWNHPQLNRLGADQIAAELQSTNDAIFQATGARPNLGRPPYGAANALVYQEFAQHGLAAIHWSVDTRDWADRNSTVVCNRAVAGARPGAIILMHDIHPTTVNAVPCIIANIRAAGYEMVTVSELFNGSTTPGKAYCNAP